MLKGEITDAGRDTDQSSNSESDASLCFHITLDKQARHCSFVKPNHRSIAQPGAWRWLKVLRLAAQSLIPFLIEKR